MNFKIGTYIQQDLGVTWPNFWGMGQRSRSQGHIYALTQYRLVLLTSY